ncbi:MAG: CHAT domain-containing protein [Microcystaceae cyanobacterium]
MKFWAIFLFLLLLPLPLRAESPSAIERQLNQGKLQSAQTQLEQALSHSPYDPQLLNLKGRLKLNQGQIEEAIAVYQQIQLPDPPLQELGILNNFWLTLDYQQKLLEEQLSFLQQDQNLILPDVASQLEEVKGQKQQISQRALFLADTLPPSWLVGQVYLNVGEREKASSVVRSLPFGVEKISLLVALEDQGMIKQALATCKEIGALCSVRWQFTLLTALAPLDSTYLDKTIKLGLQLGDAEALFQLFALQAQLGISPPNSYRAALASISHLRTALTAPNPQTKFFFQEKVIPVYRGYLEVLLENPRPENLKEARKVFERLQIAQVENLLHKLCITSSEQGIEEKLAEVNGAMVHTIVLKEATYMLLTLPSGEIIHHKVDQTEEEIETLAFRWRGNLKEPVLQDYYADGTELYDLMIRPIKESLVGVEQLIFVSDGVLRTIPPQAFYDAQKEEFLIEQVGAIRSLLGAAFLSDFPVESSNLLAFGLSESRPPFHTPLPFVEKELRFLDGAISESVIVINGGFTVDSVRRDLLTKEPKILHLASHAQFTGNPRTSLVATYQETVNLWEFESLLSLSSLDLLVLSACETSTGDNLSTLGLAGVAAQAHVQSVVGTLWKINDAASQSLMEDFYLGLKDGKGVALSLADAQRQAIQQKTHPSEWALMLLLG